LTVPATVSAPAGVAATDDVEVDLALRGLTKRFGDLTAVDDVDLSIRRGEFLALLGPSGCGKTTTLRMIGGFEDPTSGDIVVGGRSMRGVPAHQREVNTVFQAYALFPHMTVLDNVAYGLKHRGVGRVERRRVAAEALERVHLSGKAQQRPGQLSGGEQQRVALARTLVLQPRVLLLDEPLSALDQKLRKSMQIELKRLQRDVGITFVLVTHDQEEAMALADRIAVMHRGRIEQLAPPSELYDRPATPFVAGFIGDLSVLEGVVAGDELVLDGGVRVPIGRRLAAAPNGARARVGVRPESAIARAAGPGAPACVVTAMTLGERLQLVVTLGGGQELTIGQPRAGTEPAVSAAQPGDHVHVSFEPDAGLLLEHAREGAGPDVDRVA
jgi:spermidine/putrescine transport system ATP-binding protein